MGYFVIRTYKAGMIGEKTKYWVPGERPPRSSRKLKSDTNKAEKVDNSSERQVARLLHANFKTGDIFLGLDYSDAGIRSLEKWLMKQGVLISELTAAERIVELRRAADNKLRNLIDRCRREGKRLDIEIKYIAITSDMDGDTGETVRIHHHLVVNKEALPIFLRQWKLGGTAHEELYAEVDRTRLAKYMMDQVRKIPDAKKYTPSRNLIRPEPKDRIAVNGSEVKPPRGAELIYRSEYQRGRPQYIRYALPKKDDESTG